MAGDEVLTILPGTLPVDELERRLADTDGAVIMKLGRTFPAVRSALEQAPAAEEAPTAEAPPPEEPAAEGVGFEPTRDPKAPNGFRDRPVQPLRHPSG